MKIDLGGLTVMIETYIGHTDTDLIFRVRNKTSCTHGDLLTGGQYPVNINGMRPNGALPWPSSRHSIRTRSSSPATARSVAKKASRKCARALTISPNKRKSVQGGRAGGGSRGALRRPDKYKTYRQFSWGFAIAARSNNFTRSGPANLRKC